MNQPAVATLADFARLAGFKRSHVTWLKVCGRLVLTDDGRVRVAESIARIEATRDAPRAEWPETATFAEFAAIAEFKPSYITQLKGDARLVLTECGKRVRVAESLERIAQTRDPSRAGVVARHAAARSGLEAADALPTAAEAFGPYSGDAQSADEDGDDDRALAADGDYQYWRKRKERANALASERENAIAEGKLLDAAAVASAAASAATMLRTRFEALPDVLGPQVAGMGDEGAVRALIADAIEHALDEAARQFAALGRVTA
jgi:hypothetical protein